jgi:cytochrome c oxidase subunit 3
VTAHAAHADVHEHHGPPPAHQSSRVSPSVLGMLLFIASETMLFGAFFTAYFFIRVVNPAFNETLGEWPPEGFHLPVFVALVNTAILVTSSFTMHWALQSIKRGSRAGLQAGLVLTFFMGLTFLLTQVLEYARIGFAWHENGFTTVFYGLTGLHGAHVFVGLCLLLVATVRAFRGHFTPEHHHGVEIPGIYWHFVDVMWIVVYTTVYIL